MFCKGNLEENFSWGLNIWPSFQIHDPESMKELKGQQPGVTGCQGKGKQAEAMSWPKGLKDWGKVVEFPSKAREVTRVLLSRNGILSDLQF